MPSMIPRVTTQLSAIVCALLNIMVTTSHPNIGGGIDELVSASGFPLKTYHVTTEDGYILTVHRIPHGKTNKDQGSRQPVLLVHGIIATCTVWLHAGDSKALAFMLANKGYDVWLGNNRGSTFSRKHVTLDPYLNKSQFWDFSWHEMGYYDLPAIIDLVLSETGYKSIQLVAYSQGTTNFFVMASTRPEYNNKIKFAQLLAPVADASNLRSLVIRPMVALRYPIALLGNFLGVEDFLSWSEYYRNFWLDNCSVGKPMQVVCRWFVWALAGYDTDLLDGYYIREFMPMVLSNFPSGTNLKLIQHYGQTAANKEFRHFDYESDMNLQKYGSKKPPKYDLGLITIPVAVYYGINDVISVDKDAQKIVKQLPHVVLFKSLNINHNGYIWSKNIDVLVNKHVIKNMALNN